MKMLTPVALLALTAACGGSPAGPSIAEAPVQATSVPSPKPLPASLDPDYVRTIAPRRWEGGPFRHCLAPSVDRAVVEPILAEMSALSGIPRTETGPCNVTWSADYDGPAPTYTELSGTTVAIVSARVFLYHHGAMEARHESGHVLGLAHSPRASDLMAATPHVRDFSAEELAVLAWMYR